MRLSLAFAVISCLLFGLQYPEAPPPAHTGGFGEPTCHVCHFDGVLNEGGSLDLRGLEESYTPKAIYQLEVILSKEDIGRAGFQLSARFAGGASQGQQAGTFLAEGDSIAVDTKGEIQYIHQTKAGVEIADPGYAKWHFAWRAPAAGSPIVFHLAANAANGDESEFGDSIFSISKEIGSPR